MKELKIPLIVLGLMYVAIGFINWEWNSSNWPTHDRAIYVFCSTVLSSMLIAFEKRVL
jgi:hypothetical protein